MPKCKVMKMYFAQTNFSFYYPINGVKELIRQCESYHKLKITHSTNTTEAVTS